MQQQQLVQTRLQQTMLAIARESTAGGKMLQLQHLLSSLDSLVLERDRFGREVYPAWLQPQVERLCALLQKLLHSQPSAPGHVDVDGRGHAGTKTPHTHSHDDTLSFGELFSRP